MSSLPDLSALRLELGKKAEDIQANPPRLLSATISKLQAVFPDLRFIPDCIDGKTDRRYVTFPYSFISFSAAAVELFAALKAYKAVVVGAYEKIGITQSAFEQIIERAREHAVIAGKLERQLSIDLKEDKDDIAKVSKFLTDYDSWGGGKSIARGQDDFHVSSILNALGLLAASSGYVVKLCETLADHPALVDEINTQVSGAPKNNLSTTKSPLVISLLAKPFTILTGNSGTGKTRSAEDLAAMFRDADDPKQVKNVALVAVGADWTDNRNVVGYVNHLRETKKAGAADSRPVYQSTPVLDLLLEASKPGREAVPHFLILDEMNLSHVERYFADFLSAMEARDGAIRLHSEGDFRLPRFEGDTLGVPQLLPYPANLFVIGTVNVDETTYMFSPKVLDRAHVIEFQVDPKDVGRFLEDPKPLQPVPRAAAGQAEAFLELSLRARGVMEPALPGLPPAVKAAANKHLLEVLEILQTGRFEFAFRTAKEVVAYLKISRELAADKAAWDAGSWKSDLDDEILQKILPKLSGSKRRVEGLLVRLARYCETGVVHKIEDSTPADYQSSPVKRADRAKCKFPRSHGKLCDMIDAVRRDQFVSFIQ